MFRSPFRTVVLPAVIVAVVAAALAGPGFASRTRAAAAVTVTATEFKFKFSTTSVTHGSITFTLVNKGKLPHDFKIAGKKSALVKPGKTAKLTVTLKAGRSAYLCTVPGHAAAGMKGTLTVK